MKLIVSIKAIQLPEKGRNVIIHIETETSLFPFTLCLIVCLSNYYAASLFCSLVFS